MSPTHAVLKSLVKELNKHQTAHSNHSTDKFVIDILSQCYSQLHTLSPSREVAQPEHVPFPYARQTARSFIFFILAQP